MTSNNSDRILLRKVTTSQKAINPEMNIMLQKHEVPKD